MEVPPPSSGGAKKPEPQPAEKQSVLSEARERTKEGTASAPRSALDVAAQFVVDERTGRVLVRIYDTRTGETIRTIPPNQVVEFLLGSGGLDVRV